MSAASSSMMLAAGVRRLLHDLKEVVEHPVPNVSALPLEDDIFVWHGNVRSHPEGTLQGAPIHFILIFPRDYPHKQPECRLLQPVPHPNVRPATSIQVLNVQSTPHTNSNSSTTGGLQGHTSRPVPRQARWRLAMWDCIPGKNSWCSAYSVLSVLLQLQVFLLDDDLQYDTQTISPQEAIRQAHTLNCPHCPHCGEDSSTIHPAFPTQQQLAEALQRRSKLAVARPFVPARSRATSMQLRHHQRPLMPLIAGAIRQQQQQNAEPAQPSSSSSSGASAAPSSSAPSSSSSSAAVSACSTPSSSYTARNTASAAAGGGEDGAGWTVVQSKSSSKGSSSSSRRFDGPKHQQQQSSTAAGTKRTGGVNRSSSQQQQHQGLAAVTAAGVAAAGVTTASSRPAAASASAVGNNSFALLRSPGARTLSNNSSSQQQQQQVPQASSLLGAAASNTPLSKAAKKNQARSLKRQQQQQQQQQESGRNTGSTSSSSISGSSAGNSHTAAASELPQQQQQQQPTSNQQHQQEQQQCEWVEVGAKAKAAAQQKAAAAAALISPMQQQLQHLMQQPMLQLVQQGLAGHALTWTQDADDAGTDSDTTNSSISSQHQQHYWDESAAAATAVQAAAAGPFACLPRDALLSVLCLLGPSDLAALSQSCVLLHEAVEDGALWQMQMAKSFPGARLTASSMTEWKAAYQFESASIFEELRCWVTRAGPEEDVLGLPLTYTTNPVTKKVDYILAHPDLLSVTAFKLGVRLTPQGEKFDALLPLYLTASHFNRALPHMAPLLKQLAPDRVGPGGSLPAPDSWLEVMPKILNTQVVLLCDNGLSVSHRSLSVYCQVHRLLLAVCEHWALWPSVCQQLDAFVSKPEGRVKKAAPNLGLLLPLLAVGNPQRHGWRRVGPAIMEEALDRKVLWCCKHDPSLEERFRVAPRSPPDMELLRGSWTGSAVSNRLFAFHVAFLHLVACPRGSTLESVMDSADALYGWPAAALGARFQRVVKSIQGLSGWQDWFRLLGLTIPSAGTMSGMLRTAWRRGEKKGYHKAGMDYGRIHASGVSRILLKGDTYSLPPATKTVDLEVHYKWRPEHDVRFLDGAVMLFGPDRNFLEMVAWNHQSSCRTARPSAVTHSGDIMQFEQQSGKNLAHIDLSGLGPGVSEAFITLSAWGDAMLSDIIQPYVQMYEQSTGVELCQCHLDATDMATKRAYKCLVLARLYRAANGSWTVSSVGAFCQGNTFGVERMVEGCKAVR